MAKDSRFAVLGALLIAIVLGGAVRMRSQSPNSVLDQLASEKANLSKMDVILMNARIDAL